MHLTDSFTVLLALFRDVFTAPSFQSFVTLMTGWLMTPRPRVVTECIQSGGATDAKHFSSYHRLFADAVWSLDGVSEALARLVVQTFVPRGTIHLAIDDTLCRKRGLKLFGAGMHYDPLRSSKQRKATSWGHDWVTVSILVWGLSWCPNKVWALPVGFRLYKNKQGCTKGRDGEPVPADPDHKTRPELAVELLKIVAGWFPDRTLCASGDSLYGGQSVARHLPANLHLISKVAAKGVLYDFPPAKRPGRQGRPRKKGERLSGMANWAADAEPWQELDFDRFGLRTRLAVKVRKCLYYGVANDRPVTVVLSRDLDGKRPMTMFFCTDVSLDARQVLELYASRWATEVMYRDAKQTLGLEDPANRTEKAVRRTAPMALVLYTLVVVWAERGGHATVRFPDRPWYPKKVEPSFADLLSAVRRESWWESLGGESSAGTPAESLLNTLVDFASRAA